MVSNPARAARRVDKGSHTPGMRTLPPASKRAVKRFGECATSSVLPLYTHWRLSGARFAATVRRTKAGGVGARFLS